MHYLLTFLVFFSFIPSISAQEAPLVCHDDIPPASYSEEEQILVDTLFDQTMVYLEGFISTLEKPEQACQTARAIIQTRAPAENIPASDCVGEFADVAQFIAQSKVILANKEAAKACFDPQKHYTTMPLFTPNAEVKQASPVAVWLDRPLLTDYFGKIQEAEVAKNGGRVHQAFGDIVKAVSTGHLTHDISIHNLPDLWASVGWIPFYAERKDAINPAFRGGYAYAEVVGPWGLLRIKEVDGQPFGLELGMTIQLADTFYPYHFHHSQEIYIPISETQCVRQYEYAVLEPNHPLFKSTPHETGQDVSVNLADWEEIFIPQQPKPGSLTYFNRNAIHAFYLKNECPDVYETAGLVTIWARTTAHEYDQKTHLCTVVENDPDTPAERADPSDHFNCRVYDIHSWKK